MEVTMGPWEDGWEFSKLCTVMVGIEASHGIRRRRRCDVWMQTVPELSMKQPVRISSGVKKSTGSKTERKLKHVKYQTEG